MHTHIHKLICVYIWLNVHREKYRWHTLGCSHKLIENKVESESRSVVSNSLWPHGLYSPWNSPGQNTGVGSLLQGIFWARGSNPGFPHCRWILYQLSHDGSKVWCYKEQYCIGTWNVRSMNQGKLEVVKQKMPRVNIDILGISKQKWTGMGEFNSDDHYMYYCGQESLRRNGVAIKVNRRVWNAVLGRSV